MKKQEQHQTSHNKIKKSTIIAELVKNCNGVCILVQLKKHIEWVVCRYAILLDRLYSFAIYTYELETNPMTICKIAKSITADDNNQSNVTSNKRLMGF